jgi:hypothetical protein
MLIIIIIVLILYMYDYTGYIIILYYSCIIYYLFNYIYNKY